jgi:uncharacterized membrane protein
VNRGRMGLAVLSLAGLFIALYLWLYKLGAIGTLACGTGSCETVQLSPQSKFFGVDVALIGVIGYLVLLGLALLALQPRFAGPAWPARLLAVLAGFALLFTLYLTGLELFVIHAICRWCVASAVVIVLIFVLAMRELRAVPSA